MSESNTLIDKIKSRWYIPLIVAVIFFVGFLPYNSKTEYQASTTIAMVIEPRQTETSSSSSSVSKDSYVDTLDNFGVQLINKLNSVPVQIRIAEQMGESRDNIEYGKTFFEIRNHGLGEMNLSYKADEEEKANKFIKAVNSIHSTILTDIDNSSQTYKVSKRNTDQFQTVNKIGTSLENKILPPVAGFIVGLAIIVLTPKKTK